MSTIQECSGESDRSRKDSERSGDEDLTNRVSAREVASNQPSCLVNPFDKQVRSRLVEKVWPRIKSSDGFLFINGPLPHLNGRPDICLGTKIILL